MRTLFLIAPSSRIDQTDFRSDRDCKMTGLSLVGTVLARRYKILERIDVDSFRAHDLALDQTVTVRQAKPTSQRDRDTWRQRVRRLASVRHPNFLNVLDLILDGSRDLVVTERPLGHSIAEFLKERSFDLEDVVYLMPLTALDLAATFASRPNSISARVLFVETTRPQDEQVDLKRRPIFDWPPIVIKLDVWELVRPSKNVTWPFLNSREQESGSTGWAVRQVAQLTYELLGAEKRKGCAIKRWFKPVNALGNAGNTILSDGLQRSSLFESSEGFFHALQSAIRSGDGASGALPAGAWKTGEHSAASSRTNDVIRRFNRDTMQLATLAVGAVVCVALVFIVLFQERHPKAADLTEEARQAGRDLILDTDPPDTPFEVVGLNKKKLTGVTPSKLHQLNPGPYSVHVRPEGSPEYEQTVQIHSGQSSSVDHGFTVLSPQEIPSPPMEAAASASIPVVASNPEINQTHAQANTSSCFPAHRQDSTRVVRLKKPNVRYRSSAGLTSAEVKMRLIALWHQSLVGSKESRRWTAFSNLNRGVRKKAAYTAEADH
jgi:hypothetical protein